MIRHKLSSFSFVSEFFSLYVVLLILLNLKTSLLENIKIKAKKIWKLPFVGEAEEETSTSSNTSTHFGVCCVKQTADAAAVIDH